MDIQKIDIRSPKQKKMDKRYARVVQVFTQLQTEYPDARQSRLIEIMVQKRLTPLQFTAIRQALIKNGLYKFRGEKK